MGQVGKHHARSERAAPSKTNGNKAFLTKENSSILWISFPFSLNASLPHLLHSVPSQETHCEIWSKPTGSFLGMQFLLVGETRRSSLPQTWCPAVPHPPTHVLHILVSRRENSYANSSLRSSSLLFSVFYQHFGWKVQCRQIGSSNTTFCSFSVSLGWQSCT